MPRTEKEKDSLRAIETATGTETEEIATEIETAEMTVIETGTEVSSVLLLLKLEFICFIDGERRRHRSSSRNHRSSDRGGDYYDDDRDRERGHHRSSNRSSSKDRRSSRDSERDRDRRDRDRSRHPAQPRIYEQTDYDDYNGNDPQNYEEGNEGQQRAQYEDDRQQQSQKMRMMNAPIGPPSTEPPRSLVEAANRPGTRRGPNDVPVPNNNNFVGGNQITHSHSGSREHYSRDNSNELGEYIDQAVVDIHNNQQDRIPHRPLSIDDIV